IASMLGQVSCQELAPVRQAIGGSWCPDHYRRYSPSDGY
ncbi:hypothetical protein Tco_1498008, partial [Tanacetum coccineum]